MVKVQAFKDVMHIVEQIMWINNNWINESKSPYTLHTKLQR